MCIWLDETTLPHQKLDAVAGGVLSQVIAGKLVKQAFAQCWPCPTLIQQFKLDRNRRGHGRALKQNICSLLVCEFVFLGTRPSACKCCARRDLKGFACARLGQDHAAKFFFQLFPAGLFLMAPE